MDEVDQTISPIVGEDAEISIPREVLEGLGRGERVRMASFLFRNMSGLLPESLEVDDNNRLVHNNRCVGLLAWAARERSLNPHYTKLACICILSLYVHVYVCSSVLKAD